MKNLILTLFVFTAFSIGAAAQTDIIDNVFTSLKAQDTETLSSLMQDDVFVEYLGEEDFLTKEEAIAKVQEFLNEQSAASVAFKHRGDSGSGMQFAIGDIQIDGEDLRIYFVVEEGKVSELCFQENE